MSTLRRLFAFLIVAGFVLGFVGRSQAQVAAGPAVTLPKTGIVHSRQPDRGNLLANQVNYDDCHLDDRISFSLTFAGYSTTSLQVWAGSACTDTANRVQNQLQCWQLDSSNFTISSANPPAISFTVRQILFGKTLASGPAGTSQGTAGTGGTSETGGASGTGGTDTAGSSAGGTTATAGSGGAVAGSAKDLGCSDKNAVSAALTITVYFMLIDSGNVAVANAPWPVSYKLLAPPPPDVVKANIGENLLPVTFGYNAQNSDTSITGYNIYCDPPPGRDAAADAGVLPDEGAPIPNCVGSTKLIPGDHPDGANFCGRAGVSSSVGNATGLVNGVAYNVALATTDSYGNTGVLSPTDCNVPQPVTGFFEAYRKSGGQAGGGFCSFSPHPEPLPLLALLSVGTCLILRRRRAA